MLKDLLFLNASCDCFAHLSTRNGVHVFLFISRTCCEPFPLPIFRSVCILGASFNFQTSDFFTQVLQVLAGIFRIRMPYPPSDCFLALGDVVFLGHLGDCSFDGEDEELIPCLGSSSIQLS